MSPRFVSALVLLLTACSAHAVFKWSVCSSDDGPIHVRNIAVSPDPIVLPGDMGLTIDGFADRDLTNASVELSVQRKTFGGFLNIPIPCVFHVGSCTYDDVCHLVNDLQTKGWAAGMAGPIGTQIRTMLSTKHIDPDQCPQPVRQLSINNYQLHLPKIPSLLTFLTAGDYHVHVSLKDKITKMETLCLDLDFQLAQPCSGFSCFIG